MHCTDCGLYMASDARFCAGCGAAAAARDPEATQLARAQQSVARHNPRGDEQAAETERTVFTARPTMLFIKIGYLAAALGALLFVILLARVKFI